MIATLMSLGSLPSFFAFSAMNEHDASPYWSEWMVGRNTYCRFLPFSTAEDTQTGIQRNFFAASTFAASGTHCALEKTPMITSTFCSFSRRSASLIATSVFDCASAKMRDDLVSLDAAAFVDDVDQDLGADRGGLRSAAGERPGLIEDHADLDVLRERGSRQTKPCGTNAKAQFRDCTLHSIPP